jgi:hypothetical protein
MPSYFGDFDHAIEYAINHLKTFGRKVDPGRWQGVPTERHPDLMTQEIIDLNFNVGLMRGSWEDPDGAGKEWHEELASEIHPNLPWADDHFLERVAGEPTNPGKEYKNWPWWRGQVELTNAAMKPTYDESGTKQLTDFKFSHTYQERFWPRHAGEMKDFEGRGEEYNFGIRYRYGDLNDVVDLLYREPNTRQATFPIFFPEDTGAVHGGRIPCTLHYHFLKRYNRLHMWYPIRSCDAVRHFRDDLYFAARLLGWVLTELIERELRDTEHPQVWIDTNPGILHFSAYSFHVHMGDYHLL